jgi:uncharacterized membrane protein YhaH (DUF805 family)
LFKDPAQFGKTLKLSLCDFVKLIIQKKGGANLSSNVAFGSGIILLFVLTSFALFLAHIVLCVWAYRDSKRRGKSAEFALIILLAMLFFPIIGLIVYLIIRND